MEPYLIYLAAPYSDPSPSKRNWRVAEIARYAAAMVRDGILVYSPVTHGAGLVSADASLDDEYFKGYWHRHGLAMLRLCDQLHVLTLPGWGDPASFVSTEIARAREMGKPILAREWRSGLPPASPILLRSDSAVLDYQTMQEEQTP